MTFHFGSRHKLNAKQLALLFCCWLILSIVIIEIKHRYKIDLIPGVNGLMDDYYFQLKAAFFAGKK